jgi:nitrate/nitrite transport system permease protein
MSLPAPKFTPAKPLKSGPPEVLSLSPPQQSASGRAVAKLGDLAAKGLPPLIVLVVVLVVWQIACGGEASSFPAPSAIWRDSKDLIVNPFYDNGGVDKGLFWHVGTSLSRVGLGFSLAAVCGVALGVLIGA